jgi:ribosomal-protein-serine acetyltransferase
MEAHNINKTEIIVDKDIRLKVVEPEDAEPIFNTIDNEREYLKEWLPFVEETHDITYTKTFIENTIASHSHDLTFTISYQNQFVGIIGLKDTDLGNRKTEIGYWLSEKFQHKGIVTRSCTALIEFAFNDMNLHRIQLKAATKNLKSQAVAQRLGFTVEGIERDGELHSYGFVDLKVFSLLKEDQHKALHV